MNSRIRKFATLIFVLINLLFGLFVGFFWLRSYFKFDCIGVADRSITGANGTRISVPYGTYDYLFNSEAFHHRYSFVKFQSSSGSVLLGWGRTEADVVVGRSGVPDFVYYFKEPSDWHWHSNCPRELCYCRQLDLRQIQTVKGFALVSDAYSPYEIQGSNRGIVFPYWPVAILTIAPLTPWLLRLPRKWMRIKAKRSEERRVGKEDGD